ncbi:EamA family transporter, partial [Rubrivivax gelatinosus]|nr:EamA family transporter [Rubrivivax gelatinosus]
MTTTAAPLAAAPCATAPTTTPPLWPAVFILMWSTGYVAGKLGLPYAGPFTLLFLRFGVAAAVLLAVALATRAPWPRTARQWQHVVVVGLLIQALQFSGLYAGLSLGVSAGVSAVIVGLMPVCTALGAVVFLGERIGLRQVIGLTLGLAGVALVVAHKLGGGGGGGGVAGHLAVGLALLGITAGTLYQKKFCASMDLRSGGAIQLGASTLVVGVLGAWHEGLAVQWTPALVGASLWLSLVNSIGAVSVMFLLLRRGEASRVASLFYLIPAVTAVMGYAVLGETLTVWQG